MQIQMARAALAVAACGLGSGAALAAGPVCLPVQEWVTRQQLAHGELLRAYGPDRGAVVYFTANSGTRAWTVGRQVGDGPICTIQTGTGYEETPPPGRA